MKFDFNKSTVVRYTQGYCHQLALGLGQHLQGQWVYAWASNLTHAFLVTPNRTHALDITGIHPLREFLDTWKTKGVCTTKIRSRALKTFEDWDLDFFSGLYPDALPVDQAVTRILNHLQGQLDQDGLFSTGGSPRQGDVPSIRKT